MADDPSLPPRFKLVVIGETGVGKSTVTFRFTDDVYFEEHVPTLGVDFKYAGITVPDPTGTERSMMLQIWDTAGQESFQAMTSQYYRGCHGGVLCFDLTRRESFASLHAWLRRYRRNVAAASAKLGPGGPAGHARRPSAEPGHTPPSGRHAVRPAAGGTVAGRTAATGASSSSGSAPVDRKSTRLNSSHLDVSRMPSSA